MKNRYGSDESILIKRLTEIAQIMFPVLKCTLNQQNIAIFTEIRECMKDEKKLKKKSYDKYIKLTVEKYIDYIQNEMESYLFPK